MLTITDGNVGALHELYVAVGAPTIVHFPLAIKEGGALLADVGGLFHPTQLTEKQVILTPRKDLAKATSTATLNVTLIDGTIIPFRFVGRTPPDLVVDVVVEVSAAAAAADSLMTCQGSVAQVRAQLDECQATAGEAGLGKVAALILAEETAKMHGAFTVEVHNLRHLDKQQRLLVEVRRLYRLFDTSYLVLTVENRDPSKTWVLERAELSSGRGDVKVQNVATEFPALPAGDVETVVVAFKTPSDQATKQTVTAKLLERNGNRHVTLADLSL